MIVCYDVLDLRTHLAFFGNAGWHDLIFDDYLIVPIFTGQLKVKIT